MTPKPYALGGFVSRLGGVMLAPRATFADLLDGEEGGRLDLALLLGLQIVALQLPHLIRVLWFAAAVDPGAGLMNLLNLLFNAVLVPLLAAMGGGVVLGALAPKTDGESPDRSRLTDLSCLAVLPLLSLQVLAAVLVLLTGALTARWIGAAVFGLGGFWFVALMISATRLVRARADRGAS